MQSLGLASSHPNQEQRIKNTLQHPCQQTSGGLQTPDVLFYTDVLSVLCGIRARAWEWLGRRTVPMTSIFSMAGGL
jgi:hypothetical protein